MSKPTASNPKIKYVKRARMWVKTWFEADKQVQQWATTKQELSA